MISNPQMKYFQFEGMYVHAPIWLSRRGHFKAY